VLNSNPIAGIIVGDLTPGQQATVRQVLDRMIRDTSLGRHLRMIQNVNLFTPYPPR
jgi:hypothetical protein